MIFDLSQVKTPESILDDFRKAIQRHLDSKAQVRGYDDIKSAALRAGYPGPFHDEGVKYASWMDMCWAKSYEVLAKVQRGEMAQPSVPELIAQMPELVL